MNEAASWLVGLALAAIGVLGLYLASRAADGALALFGLSLFVFAILFVFGLIRRGYDARERALAAAEAPERRRAAA
jgi:hypothetical protein